MQVFFEQLGGILPSPNEYRTASGAPGAKYWQQRADYDIDVTLDEKNLTIIGTETVTYHNNAPETLNYLWLQLDENEHNPTNESNYFNASKINQPVTDIQLEGLDVNKQLKNGGVNIIYVEDAAGKKIPYTINYTMMRIDMPQALKSGQQYIVKIKWNYKIPVITNTITIQNYEKPRNQFYIGGGIDVNKGLTVNNVHIGGLLKTKKDHILGLHIGTQIDGGVVYGFQSYWKLKLK